MKQRDLQVCVLKRGGQEGRMGTLGLEQTSSSSGPMCTPDPPRRDIPR